MMSRLILLALAWLVAAGPIAAHEMQPAFLGLAERSDGSIDITWKVPLYKGRPLPVTPVFPESWSQLTEPNSTPLGNGILHRWRINPGGTGLAGATLSIEGPRSRLTDVLVRATLTDGHSTTNVLRPEIPSTTLLFDAAKKTFLVDYIVIGVEHIWFGFDHLLFVLCLVLIVRDRWTLVKTITAFTVAHSVTLSAATLGWASVPGPPVEAVIALSIVFLARELVVRHENSVGLTERYPWSVALTFGLLHGFGFAGALSEVGLPPDQIPLALLNFNIGVELGQLAFVCGFILLSAGVRRFSPKLPDLAFRPAVFGIGIVASFWCVERIAGFWN